MPLYFGRGKLDDGAADDFRKPIEGDYDPSKVLVDRPLTAPGSSLCFTLGWDGLLCASYADRNQGGVMKLARSGKMTLRVPLHRRPDYESCRERPGVDGAGFIYVRVNTQRRQQEIWRISLDGKVIEPIVRDVRSGGQLDSDDRCMVVAPNGTFWILGSSQRIRIFASDGRILFASAQAREADERRAQQRDDDDL